MTTPVGKTYIPGEALRIRDLCDFVTKHGTAIVAATVLVAPADAPAMEALIATIQTGCLLVERVHKAYDPSFGDVVSGPG